MVDTTFIEGVLITSVFSLMFLYYYQNKQTNTNYNNNNNNNMSNNKVKNFSNNQNLNNVEKFMPIIAPNRILGPVKDFHHKFNSRINACADKDCLGWRNWWIKNKTNSKVPEDANFQGIPRGHLDNMDSLVSNALINREINNGL